MLRGKKRSPKAPKNLNNPHRRKKRWKVWITQIHEGKDPVTLRAWWLPGNGMSCPHCCLGATLVETGYKCKTCGAVVTKVEEDQ